MRLKLTRWLLPVFIAVLATFVLLTPIIALPEEETWESYTVNDDNYTGFYGNLWRAQTFTIDPESHSVTQIYLKIYRIGSPGTMTVSIRETESDVPIGLDLTSGTINGDAITTDSGGVWYGVELTEYNLNYGEVYAIVVRAEAGDASNLVVWRVDASSPTYSGGMRVLSSNGGVSWTTDSGDDCLFEIKGKALLEVSDAKVFNGYLEDDDMLVTFKYFNTYVPYYPNGETGTNFWLQFRSTDGTDVIAQTNCRTWGYKPGSIYLSADQASSLTPGSAYRVYIYGDIDETPAYYYTLTAVDWRGEDLTLLDSWVITAARDIGDYYDTDIVVYASSGEVLNDEGGVIFVIGIPALDQVRPDMFQTVVHVPEYEPEDWENDFDTSISWVDQVGTETAAVAQSIGDFIGLGGRETIAFGLLIPYLIIVVVVAKKGGDAAIVTMLALPIIMISGTWLRVLDYAMIAVCASVLALLVMYRFWFSRT